MTIILMHIHISFDVVKSTCKFRYSMTKLAIFVQNENDEMTIQFSKKHASLNVYLILHVMASLNSHVRK